MSYPKPSMTLLVGGVFILGSALGFGVGYLARPSATPLPPGRTAALVTVPDLTGLTVVAAEQLIMNSGLPVEVTVKADSGARPGTVIEQTPSAGTSVGIGTLVEVFVSRKPSPGS
jgi:beta-lactam-binding protein with PASTA domain